MTPAERQAELDHIEKMLQLRCLEARSSQANI